MEVSVRVLSLCLDTSAYSRFRSGHSEVIDWLARAYVVYVPIIVIGELEAGFRRGSRYAQNHRTLTEFLEESFVTIIDVTQASAKRYGLVMASLRSAGKPIPTNDVWIAAMTLEVGAHLLTFDHDFKSVEGLEHTLLYDAPLP